MIRWGTFSRTKWIRSKVKMSHIRRENFNTKKFLFGFGRLSLLISPLPHIKIKRKLCKLLWHTSSTLSTCPFEILSIRYLIIHMIYSFISNQLASIIPVVQTEKLLTFLASFILIILNIERKQIPHAKSPGSL
jgi:hypothetical protein